MIGDEEIRRGGPEEEMIRLAQQGKIETILCCKEKIALNHLFEFPKNFDTCPPPSPSLPQPLEQTSQDPLDGLALLSSYRPIPKTILIEGAPGGGKSTLAFHICHHWAQGAFWLARFNVIILAYLRDEAIQNANTLADILPAATNISALVSLIQASYGYRVLFIFDGWDEFPRHLMNNSLVSTIIRQPHKLSLNLSTILITSRPVSSGNLLHIADRRVEILGFTQHQIHEYIGKALNGNSTRIQKLVQHLEEHPVIEGYCYVPLHVAILVHVFLTMKGALPTTLHELFCSLVLCCIVREQATHEPDTASLPEFVTLDNLPDKLKSKLNNLSILAYNGVMQNKVVFYSMDLQASHLPCSFPSLGLLQAVEGLTLYGTSLSYNFLHLSVQELLSAYYISLMVPSEQVKVFKELFKSSRFQAVLHYYCGFTKLVNPEIQAFVSSFQSKKSSLKDLLPLLHCFFEAQQPSLCQLVDSRFIPNEQQALNSRDLTPVDFLVIGYFITSLLSTSTANTPTIHLVVDDIDDHRLKMLLNELTKYPVGGMRTSAGALSLRLELNKLFITWKGASHIASLLNNSSAVSEVISELVLRIGDIRSDEDALLSISEALQTNTSLTKLSLPHMSLYHTKQNGSALTKMLQVNKSLTDLDLSNNSAISDSGARCIFEGLQHNTVLVNLNLSQTSITATDPNTAGSLTKMLQVNKSLTHLDLSNNITFSDSGARCIFEGLQHNTTLVNVNLSHTGIAAITPNTARSLTTMLQVNQSLKYLHLSNYFSHKITDFGIISCIFKGLEHNTSLCYLDLHVVSSFSYIHPVTTAEHIARALKSNCSLHTLNIAGWRFLGRNGISLILDSLMINSTLKTLYVGNIDSVTLSTFKRAREASNLPPINFVLSNATDYNLRSSVSQQVPYTYMIDYKPSSVDVLDALVLYHMIAV